MKQYTEEVYSGFCKKTNGTRTIMCEFVEEDGRITLESVDCRFGECDNTNTCLLMKPVREKLMFTNG